MQSCLTHRVLIVLGALLLAAIPDTADAQSAQTARLSAAADPPAEEAEQSAEETFTTAEAEQDLPFTMRFGARLQVRASYDDLPGQDPAAALHLRRARASLSGAAYERFDYALQAELAGSGARLLDANVRTRILPELTLWLGQGKALFGRQQLTSSGNLHFVDRSIVDARFAAGRQQGVALQGRLAGNLIELGAGIYNGEGINLSTNPDRRFLTVGRVVVTPFGPYRPIESAHEYPRSARLAIGISGMNNSVSTEDMRIEVTRLNSEAAFRLHGLSLTAEVFREWAGSAGSTRATTDGWYVQPGYLLPGKTHEVALRYAAVGATEGLGGVVETGAAYSYYIREHSAKVQADVRYLRLRDTGEDRREVRLQLQIAL